MIETIRRWFASTPNRTFVLYPVGVILFEWLTRGRVGVEWRGAVLLVWGYLQYRLVGGWRVATGGGGPGLDTPPDRLVTSGPYRFSRNPMYLGHLIFVLGLAIAFQSFVAIVILLANGYWFNKRAEFDEKRLIARFGAEYTSYMGRVNRWAPFIG